MADHRRLPVDTRRSAAWLREHRGHTPRGPTEVQHLAGTYTWTCPCAAPGLTQFAPGGDGAWPRRASGDVACPHCRMPYRRHPLSWHRSDGGDPYLHRLCDGTLVHL